jgi:hypothetical protein
MRLANALLVSLAVLWPAAAGAVEVRLGAKTEAVYDDNVFRTSEGEAQDDVSFRFSPTIDIRQDSERLGFSLYYEPIYEAFTTYTDANALSHNLSNKATYRFSDRTNIGLASRFQVKYVLNDRDFDTIDEGTTPVPDNDIRREEMFLFDTSLNLTHALSPRWTAATDLAFDLFDPRERRNTVGSQTVSAFQNFSYAHDASNVFGIGGGAVVQMFDEVNTLPGSDTYIFRLFASYERHFGESTTLTIRAGPAYILTRQDDAHGVGSPVYPFIPVDGDTTVGALRAQGIPIMDVFGQGLTDDTVVLDGSVVVPNPRTCIDDVVGPMGSTVLEGSRCSFQLVLRADDPVEGPAAAVVTDPANETETEIPGSESISDDSTFTIFGDIELLHRWTPNLYSSISYSRSDSTTAGQGASSVADSVSFLTVWRPTPLWDVSLRAGYVKRQSPTDLSRSFLEVVREPDAGLASAGLVRLTGSSVLVKDSRSVDTQRWGAAARIARRVTRHITVSALATWSTQDSAHTSRSPNEFGNISAILGFKYDFDPFRF